MRRSKDGRIRLEVTRFQHFLHHLPLFRCRLIRRTYPEISGKSTSIYAMCRVKRCRFISRKFSHIKKAFRREKEKASTYPNVDLSDVDLSKIYCIWAYGKSTLLQVSCSRKFSPFTHCMEGLQCENISIAYGMFVPRLSTDVPVEDIPTAPTAIMWTSLGGTQQTPKEWKMNHFVVCVPQDAV